MGWPWPFSSAGPAGNRPSQSTSEATAQTQGIALTDEQRIRIFGKPSGNISSPTREEQADAELDAFINSFANTTEDSDPASKIAKSRSEASSKVRVEVTDQQSNNERLFPDGSLDISPSAMYPRAMSCRQAFDQAFYCQSLGGKFNDIYRFGHLQSCSEQWGAFWFCMRTRTLPDKEKEKQIREHYAGRDERKKKEVGSSEDIWEIRPVAVKRAFGKDPDVEDDGSGVRTTS